jgi:hypothetical protein
MTLNLGYAISTVIFFAILAVTCAAQNRVLKVAPPSLLVRHCGDNNGRHNNVRFI